MTSGKKTIGVMMMMRVFLMASNCRYHGTSAAVSALLSDADRVAGAGVGSFDVIASAKHCVAMKRQRTLNNNSRQRRQCRSMAVDENVFEMAVYSTRGPLKEQRQSMS